MQTEPWSADLLDYLAVAPGRQRLRPEEDAGADRHVAGLSEPGASCRPKQPTTTATSFAGPRAKRLTAEQFLDAVWQLTGAAPTRFDAPVAPRQARSQPAADATDSQASGSGRAPTRQRRRRARPIAFRKQFDLKARAAAGRRGHHLRQRATRCTSTASRCTAGDNWEAPDADRARRNRSRRATNELLIVAKNGGAGPNPAGLFFEAATDRVDERRPMTHRHR